MLEAFGFHKGWLDWLFGWLASPRYLILLNDALEGFFPTSRGLRQGDPLSPFLFIIMAKALGRYIELDRSLGGLEGL